MDMNNVFKIGQWGKFPGRPRHIMSTRIFPKTMPPFCSLRASGASAVSVAVVGIDGSGLLCLTQWTDNVGLGNYFQFYFYFHFNFNLVLCQPYTPFCILRFFLKNCIFYLTMGNAFSII